MSDASRQLTVDDARRIGEQIGIDWATSLVDAEQFRLGLPSSWSMAATIPRQRDWQRRDHDRKDRLGAPERVRRPLHPPERDGSRS